MVAAPNPVAVTRPLLSTVATDSSLDSQVKSVGAWSVALPGVPLTRSDFVSPTKRLALAGSIQHDSTGITTRTSISEHAI